MKSGQLNKPLADQLKDLGTKIVLSKSPNRHERRKLKALAQKAKEQALLLRES